MFKYKKMSIYLITIIYFLITIIEVIRYLLFGNNLFGLYYLYISLLIIFLIVPCAYNYKKYYSSARISKLIIVILLIIFDSFILEHVLFKSMGYVDFSKDFIKSIFIYKNILKPIIAFLLIVFTTFEFKLDDLIKKSVVNKSID